MAPTATTPLSPNNKGKSEQGNEPKQLVRPPPESSEGVLDFLSSKLLTRQDVDSFIRNGPSKAPKTEVDPNEEAYNERRRQIRELAAKVESGEAEIDEHGRLIPTQQAAAPQGNDGGVQLPPPPPARPPPVNPADREEEERQWLEREDRDAAEAIARAVKRYRQEGVPEEDFFLVKIAPREQSAVSFTFRRICFAVLAVTTAFVVIMLQSMPLLRTVKQTNLEFDSIMYDLLEVRDFVTHAKHCIGLHRDERNTTRMERLIARLRRNDSHYDCAEGVLHVPSKHLLFEKSIDELLSVDEYDVLEPYVTSGVNVTWFHPCSVPEEIDTVSDCFPGSNASTCVDQTADAKCFRGVHDGVISSWDVHQSMKLAAHLINQGGDHIEIHRNVSLLSDYIPSAVSSLKRLLHDKYHLQGQWNPVAFRISVALPMDGTGVRLYKNMPVSSWLENTFNRTVYSDWAENARKKNEFASYSLLASLFGQKSVRDVCFLMSDLEADPDFAVHTSVFLSDSAGIQYAGGAALYVDDHPSNAVPRNKIQRGISIDGSPGRVVVSSGGAENRRCRLPTRAGIRAVLQIWWNCTND